MHWLCRFILFTTISHMMLWLGNLSRCEFYIFNRFRNIFIQQHYEHNKCYIHTAFTREFWLCQTDSHVGAFLDTESWSTSGQLLFIFVILINPTFYNLSFHSYHNPFTIINLVITFKLEWLSSHLFVDLYYKK